MRKVYDYYYENYHIFRIGYVEHLFAHTPLELHQHKNMMEFVYMKRGTQNYRVSNKDYTVHQGEVFYTLPNELHDTGSSPEEKSVLYYLTIDLKLLENLKIFLSLEEYYGLERFINGTAARIFQASSNLSEALNRLVKCFDINDVYYHTRIRNALSQVLISLLMPYVSEKSSPLENVKHSLTYIQEHLNENIHISELPAIEHTSLSTYNRNFVKAMGLPPGEYILRQKIEKAKELLIHTNLAITEIAFHYGFSSSQYFSTVFKRFCNTTPRQFRSTYKPENSTTRNLKKNSQ